jgi:hypothetical protein
MGTCTTTFPCVAHLFVNNFRPSAILIRTDQGNHRSAKHAVKGLAGCKVQVDELKIVSKHVSVSHIRRVEDGLLEFSSSSAWLEHHFQI